MPIEQIPLRLVPGFWGGISTKVSPEGGKILEKFKLGMFKEAEQSKVPFVSIFKTVGISALAVETFGKYPPLAVMVTTCLSSVKLILLAVFESVFFELKLFSLKKIKPEITIIAIKIIDRVVFMQVV